MKKIISLIVIISMLFSFSAFAEQSEQNSGYSSYAAHMYNLGLMKNMTDFEFSEYPVTRSEFANVVMNLIGYTYGAQSVFSDVSYDTPYYEGIMTAAEYNYMNGNGDGKFRPDDPITYNEIYKIFVTMLDFRNIAEYHGGYPLGYYNVAKQLGITADEQATAYVTRATLPKLVFKLLQARCCDLVAIKEDSLSFSLSNITFLEKYLKLKYIKGVIGTDEIGSIETESVLISEDRIRINNITFVYEHSYNDKLLGKFGEAFYDPETNKVVSLAFPSQYNKEISINGDEISYKSSSMIEYGNDDKLSKLSVPSGLIYILNGEPVLYFDITNVTDETLTFINNNQDSKYDILRIEKPEFYAVSYVYGNSLVYDITGKVVSLDESNGKEIIIVDSDGAVLSINDIKKDMVLSVVETSNKKIVTVFTDVLSGIVTGTGDNEIVIDDKVCKLNPKLNISGIKLGEYKKCYFDSVGRVFAITDGEASDANYAFVINGGYDDSFEFSYCLKLLKDNGDIVTCDVSETLILNGSQKKVRAKAALPAELYENDVFKRQLIRFSINDEGKISKIDIPSDTPGTGDFFKATSVNASYSLNPRSIGGKITVDDTTKIFVVPESDSDRENENYYVFTRSNLNTMQSYNATAYQTSDRYTADILVLKGNYRGISYETQPVVFVKETQSVDAEGNLRKKIYYFDGENESSVYIDYTKFPQVSSLNKGDTIRISVFNDEVNGFEYIYDFNGGKWKLSTNPTSDSFESSNRMSMGYIAGFDGEILKLSYNKDFSSVSPYTMEGYLTASFQKVVVEKDGTRVLIRKGENSDIRPHDKAVIMLRSGASRRLIIYKTK